MRENEGRWLALFYIMKAEQTLESNIVTDVRVTRRSHRDMDIAIRKFIDRRVFFFI